LDLTLKYLVKRIFVLPHGYQRTFSTVLCFITVFLEFAIIFFKNRLELLLSLIVENPTKNWENGGESKAEVAEQRNNLRARKRR